MLKKVNSKTSAKQALRETNKEATPPINKDFIRTLAKLLEETDLNEIEYETAGIRVKVGRHHYTNSPAHIVTSSPLSTKQAVPVPTKLAHDSHNLSENFDHNHPGLVKSPMVGVIYFSPEPGAKKFIVAGEQVKQGQTLCLIEAMKTFNPVLASRDGTISKILIEEGHPVEFDEPLLIIE